MSSSSSPFNQTDAYFMRRAIAVARRSGRAVRPNPNVGAVVVAGGRIISLGWHEHAGGSHAEAIALERAGDRTNDATLYVTLEPCNHQGRTPPCTAAILAARIQRVVFGLEDSNPHVCGGGAEYLRSRGLDVSGGLLRSEIETMVRPWYSWITTGKPFVETVTIPRFAPDSSSRQMAAGWERWIKRFILPYVDAVVLPTANTVETEYIKHRLSSYNVALFTEQAWLEFTAIGASANDDAAGQNAQEFQSVLRISGSSVHEHVLPNHYKKCLAELSNILASS